MKVGLNINKVINTYNQNLKIEKTNEVRKKIDDRIEISKEGKELAKYIDIAKNTEVDNPKVDQIRELINKGEYNIDNNELAKSMIESNKGRDV